MNVSPNPSSLKSDAAEGRYQQLTTFRDPYLRRGRDCAAVTIPSLLPPSGSTGSTDMPTPYQAMGARGVNNLASKLLLALLPPNQSFFRLNVADDAKDQLAGASSVLDEINTALAKIERTVTSQIETKPVRVSVFEVLKHLIVAGNILALVQPDLSMRVFRLDQYVVKREPSGDILEILVLEKVSAMGLPESVRASVTQDEQSPQDNFDLYTWIKKQPDGTFKAHQEVKGITVPGSEGSYKSDRTPWLALRWNKIDGEDYGRGHCEEYYGDLRSLEGLSKAILEGASVAAKVLFLVNPNGTTQERTISEAPNMAVRSGNAEDVTVLQVNKYADFRVAAETIDKLEKRLSAAFLLTSSVSRQAERVTAEEIRLLAGELEDALGGVYALLAQEFQLPFVRRLLFQLQDAGKVPQLPEQVEPSIITGMEALGRGHDLTRLTNFASVLTQALGPQVFAQTIIAAAFITRVGAALGVDTDGLVKSPEQLQQEQATAQQQALMQHLGPEAMRQQGANQQPQQGGPNGP